MTHPDTSARPWAVVVALRDRIHASGDDELVAAHLRRLHKETMMPNAKGWDDSLSWQEPGWCGYVLASLEMPSWCR